MGNLTMHEQDLDQLLSKGLKPLADQAVGESVAPQIVRRIKHRQRSAVVYRILAVACLSIGVAIALPSLLTLLQLVGDFSAASLTGVGDLVGAVFGVATPAISGPTVALLIGAGISPLALWLSEAS